MIRVGSIARSLLTSVLEIDADSPFRVVSLAITLCLFAALSVVTVEIISGESGLPRGWMVDPFYVFILSFIPGLILHRLNESVKQRYNLEPFPFLLPSDEI